MPRKSPYRVILSPEQRVKLEALARAYTSPYFDIIRAKIALYAADGMDNDQIAIRLDTARQIVSKWRKRFYEDGFPGLEERPRRGDQPAFPPRIVVAIKALACELPHALGIPLSRFSIPEIRREILAQGLVASIGDTTIWRWLSDDAIRPWTHRTWIFPRDPAFEQKAGLVLDLYAGVWEGQPLTAADCVLSTDEKTSIQARGRIHATLPPAPGTSMRVEHEYERRGAWGVLGGVGRAAGKNLWTL